MLPYFPFDPATYAMTMGVQPLALRHIIEVDTATVLDELHLKRELLDADAPTYCALPPNTSMMQWDALSVLLPAMATRYPQWFSLHRAGAAWEWQNRLQTRGDALLSLAMPRRCPMGRSHGWGDRCRRICCCWHQMRQRAIRWWAASYASPICGGWRKSWGSRSCRFTNPCQGFAEAVGRSTELLFARMKQWHPVWRLNWSLLPLPRLNLVPQFFGENDAAAAALTLANIGARCHLRIERQTLTRLPMTDAILFTVRTYQMPIARLAEQPERLRQFAAYLPTVPAALLRYKGIDRYHDLLLEYLRLQLASIDGQT